MSRIFSAAGVEFLQHYQLDVHSRWSPEDLAAQQEWVNAQIAGCHWLDWSSPSAALQLVQASHAHTSMGTAEKYQALVLAGPGVELIEPATLFRQAASTLTPVGKLIGLMPALRDNSPESQQFIQHATAALWPYYTAEELLEMLREAGWKVETPPSGFIAIPRFNHAVVKGELGFHGFAKVFEQLMAEGYDPMEVGWGELRFVAMTR